MNDTQMKIAEMVAEMQFERRAAVPQETKAMTAALLQKVEGLAADINKLRLKLWHAADKKDYRSLPLEDAKTELERMQSEMNAIIKTSF